MSLKELINYCNKLYEKGYSGLDILKLLENHKFLEKKKIYPLEGIWLQDESVLIAIDRESEFFTKIDKVLTENMVVKDMDYMTHPYTDVWALRGLYNFACINFSIGYYNYHTRNEYVIPEDVYNGIKMGREMIESLGYTLHYKEKQKAQMRYGLWD
jgi:hypothetical protein